MLIGEYTASLGEKNRIALPKKLRDLLADELIITRGYEGCAILLDKARWQELIAVIDEDSLLRLSVRDTKRYLLGGAIEVELDKQGRFIVPEYLMHHLDAQGDITFLGVGAWVEMWSAEKWQQKSEYLVKNAADIAESLANLNK